MRRVDLLGSTAGVFPPPLWAQVYCILEGQTDGTRVAVIDPPNRIEAHLAEMERAVVVPDWLVEYPPRFEQYHEIVCRAEAEGKRHTNRHRFST